MSGKQESPRLWRQHCETDTVWIRRWRRKRLRLSENNPRKTDQQKTMRESIMAEIDKLSVGKALEKLRGKQETKSNMAHLDQEIDALDEEARRLRALRLRVERDQKNLAKRD
jgi:hypothetical protein